MQDQLKPLRAKIFKLENVNVLLQNKIDSQSNFYNIIYKYNVDLVSYLNSIITNRDKVDSDIANLEIGLNQFLN